MSPFHLNLISRGFYCLEEMSGCGGILDLNGPSSLLSLFA